MVVSIVIPVYNEEQTILKLLEKIKILLSNYSIDLIVIDSQSTDRTVSLIKEFRRKFKKLRLFQIKHSEFNHSSTRNMGVSLARGEFVCFFSADAIPKNNSWLSYFIDDLNKKNVVAVFGKQIPYGDTPIIQKLEWRCLFERLDRQTNRVGIFLQNKKTLLGIHLRDQFLSYSLFNTFSCYRRSFLLKHPFPKTNCYEDILMGKFIIEKGFSKIYDRRCVVIHSHKRGLREYYVEELENLRLWLKKLNFSGKHNLRCKVRRLLDLKLSPFRTIYNLFLLFFYYFIKIVIFVQIYVESSLGLRPI